MNIKKFVVKFLKKSGIKLAKNLKIDPIKSKESRCNIKEQKIQSNTKVISPIDDLLRKFPKIKSNTVSNNRKIEPYFLDVSLKIKNNIINEVKIEKTS